MLRICSHRLKDRIAVITGGAAGSDSGLPPASCRRARGSSSPMCWRKAGRPPAGWGSALAFTGSICAAGPPSLRWRMSLSGGTDALIFWSTAPGIARPVPTLKLSEEVLDEVIDINLKAPALLLPGGWPVYAQAGRRQHHQYFLRQQQDD